MPPAALLVHGNRSYLLVERSPWTFERRPVEIGEPIAEGIIVTRGLAAGERVVRSNAILFN